MFKHVRLVLSLVVLGHIAVPLWSSDAAAQPLEGSAGAIGQTLDFVPNDAFLVLAVADMEAFDSAFEQLFPDFELLASEIDAPLRIALAMFLGLGEGLRWDGPMAVYATGAGGEMTELDVGVILPVTSFESFADNFDRQEGGVLSSSRGLGAIYAAELGSDFAWVVYDSARLAPDAGRGSLGDAERGALVDQLLASSNAALLLDVEATEALATSWLEVWMPEALDGEVTGAVSLLARGDFFVEAVGQVLGEGDWTAFGVSLTADYFSLAAVAHFPAESSVAALISPAALAEGWQASLPAAPYLAVGALALDVLDVSEPLASFWETAAGEAGSTTAGAAQRMAGSVSDVRFGAWAEGEDLVAIANVTGDMSVFAEAVRTYVTSLNALHVEGEGLSFSYEASYTDGALDVQGTMADCYTIAIPSVQVDPSALPGPDEDTVEAPEHVAEPGDDVDPSQAMDGFVSEQNGCLVVGQDGATWLAGPSRTDAQSELSRVMGAVPYVTSEDEETLRSALLAAPFAELYIDLGAGLLRFDVVDETIEGARVALFGYSTDSAVGAQVVIPARTTLWLWDILDALAPSEE